MEGGSVAVAKVDGHPITRAEWEAAHRDQIERVRRQMPGLDAKLFDTPEMRQQTLDALVRERVMLAAADKLHLGTSNERLQRELLAMPQLASLKRPDGSIDVESYKALLSAQGMSPAQFEARMRQDITLRQVLGGIAGTTLGPAGPSATALDALFQQREIVVQRFVAKDYAAKVTPGDADLDKFYKDPAHAALFQAPEQASIEYAVLDLDSLKKGITVPEDDLRKYYTQNEKRYSSPEERRASHILIKSEKDAPAAARQQAKAKAETLLAELKKNPSSFAEVARKNSGDPGSAEKGGDLDFFGRGAMVKPFEDAAFSLEPGMLSAVVESDFGYHIILVTAKRGGDKKSFESVRAEIEDEARKQQAQKKFSEAAVEFTNMVYEQSDSLKPVLDKFKLELRTAKDLKRAPAPGATGPLASAKFLEALFGNDVLRNKRNTEAVEAGPNMLVSGRVVQYAPARTQTFAEVSAKVRELVVAEQAAALARSEGEARLAALRKAPDSPMGQPNLTVSRAQTREQPRPLIDAVLKAPADKLPDFVGVDLKDDGYAVVKLSKVLGRDPALADVQRAQQQYAQAWGDAESQAYYAALKARFKVDVKGVPEPAGTAPGAPN
jgi:peptidyl-prolyl cis-trans isomerase D